MESLIRGFTILCLFSSLLSFAQQEEVLWSADVQLKWADFKGQPDRTSPVAAVTASGISYEFSSLERNGHYEVDYTVSTFFYPEQSWYKPEVCDALILSHEQLHFDISELFARKMRKRMAETQFTKNVKAEVKAIYRDVLKELARFQKRYDQETNFSRNREAQIKWNQEVKEALGN